ncbi:helix-turn-helix transcriptional regulator [Lacticaseibacillus mingshuiensis]|uniref:helix-turn-helix transcriptional regulator n=1 Tax=Lacticaseibacillus mingshuiensis TaxID=2799574 RepID=UPI00194EA54D|nr:helix-turn-helix transcriptional regulator [Lacticaseibacillus mingshuiensis]
MQREQGPLRILGERVRYYRKLKGLSQAELAKDICTQATISLIEKRNKVPSMNILMRLIGRLDITMDDIVVANHDSIQQSLSDTDKALRRGAYPQAAEFLAKVRSEKLTTEEDKRRFNYYSGMVELFAHKAPDEAIYYFGRVLTPMLVKDRDLLTIMATLGLGLAYAEKGTHERARVYIDQALALLHDAPFPEGRYLDVVITIYWHISRVFFELEEYAAVLTNVKTGIDFATKHESLFLLDELYALQARAYDALADKRADENYQIAVALARVNHSPQLLAALETETSRRELA